MLNPQTMPNSQNEPVTRFYQEPVVWLMMTILTVTFCMGVVILTAAIRSGDGVVVDNFYKDGRSHYMRLEEDQAALDMGLNAIARLEQDQLLLQLAGELDDYPEQLMFKFISRTNHRFDYFMVLERQEGNIYSGKMTQELSHPRWLIQLQPSYPDQDGSLWRLHGEILWPLERPIQLRPALWS